MSRCCRLRKCSTLLPIAWPAPCSKRCFPSIGAALMAIAIMISAFGCINGMLLSGARAYFAMARDGLFFRRAGESQPGPVSQAASLAMQGVWACFLVLVRTYDPATGAFGNLYSNLLDYVVSAALIVLHSDDRGSLPLAPPSSERRAALPRLGISRSAGPLYPERCCDPGHPFSYIVLQQPFPVLSSSSSASPSISLSGGLCPARHFDNITQFV